MKVCINKGKHYHSNLWFRVTHFFCCKHYSSYKITFNKDCWYPTIEHTGWNKLFGLTGLKIHKNSARIVWQPDFNRKGWIKLAAYCYVDGVRVIKEITSVKVDKRFTAIVEIIGNSWVFYIDLIHEVDILANKKPHLIECQLYFGGKSEAPHKMCVKFNK